MRSRHFSLFLIAASLPIASTQRQHAEEQHLRNGRVDPVLDCNGWMLDDQSLLPRFRFGDPVWGTDLIRRGDEVFRIGEHFDVDRRGRVYRPHQYVALANGHVFKEATVREKLALPECAVGPRHRYKIECRILRDTIEQSRLPALVDPMFGRTAPLVMELQFKRKCLSEEEAADLHKLLDRLKDAAPTQPPPSKDSLPDPRRRDTKRP